VEAQALTAKKVLAAIGLALVLYCWIRVAVNRRSYTRLRLTIWLILIGFIGGWCVMALVWR
jgi:hypothetical protein